MIMLKVLQDNHLTATKEEISVMMDIADKNKDGWSNFVLVNQIKIKNRWDRQQCPDKTFC